MVYDLVVTAPFGSYNRGDKITDPATIAAVLESNPDNVVQIPEGPDDPTPITPDP